jgi:HEAT repeat protein
VASIWADDGGKRLAVATDDGSLLRSDDRGDHWVVAAADLPILSLTWSEDGSLYVGTNSQGVYRLASDGTVTDIATTQGELASTPVVGLSQAEGRLFAATPTVLFHTDGATWTRSMPLPDRVTTVVAAGRETVYVGTATSGVYRSVDAGQTWQPAWEGLGLAAGQMVRITALRADPQEPDLLYAAIDYLVGSTHVQASAAGTFKTLDGGTSWQPLAGPVFPEAEHASSLVLIPGRPLYVHAVTDGGLQSYTPDVTGTLAALESADPRARAAAARELSAARPLGVWSELLAALDDPEPAVGLAASQALGHINDPASVSSLLSALQHPDGQVRLGSAQALGMMGTEAAVEPLRAMLLNGEGLEVSVAGEALASIGSPAAIEALLVALADPEPTARWHMAMAGLEKIGEPAVGPLVEMLKGEDVHARRSAAQALGWIGSPSAAAALEDARTDTDEVVRDQAAWALSEIVDPAAANQLPVTWATILDHLQPLRWLVLALSLAAAGWLAVGNGHSLATP